MGYRSNIRIRLKKEDYERLVKEFENDQKVINGTGVELFKMLDKYVEQKDYEYYDLDQDGQPIIKKADVVYFGWDWVKWYDGYEDVDFIMHWLEKDDNMPFAFTRVGESVEGDFDMRAKHFENIYISINFDDDSE